jgi:hypothetical protein
MSMLLFLWSFLNIYLQQIFSILDLLGTKWKSYKACLNHLFLISGSWIAPQNCRLLPAIATLAGNDSEVISSTGNWAKHLPWQSCTCLHPEQVCLK